MICTSIMMILTRKVATSERLRKTVPSEAAPVFTVGELQAGLLKCDVGIGLMRSCLRIYPSNIHSKRLILW